MTRVQKESQVKLRIPSNIFWMGILMVCLVASCVPARKLAYLQAKGGLKASHPNDSIVATYPQLRTKYQLQPEDVISLRVASITEDQYNFIKGYETDLGIIRELNQYSTGGNQSGQIGGNQLLQGGGMQNQGGDQSGGLATIVLDRLNTGFKLDGNGALELPQIGELKLAGLTVTEAEDTLKKALEGFFETPMVRVQLLNYHFTILGEVEGEGRYISYNPDLTIFDAITIAGNLTEFADRANVKVVRQEESQSKVFYLDLLDEQTLLAEHLQVKRGDLIVISALDARNANRFILKNLGLSLGIVSSAISLALLLITISK